MVMVKENVSYPMFPVNVWWAIRRKFIQSMPPRVTDTYLATLLSMEVNSVRKNLLSPLKRMGLIDNDGKPTERAIRWRNDEQYASVCEEIRKEIYPHELLDIYPDADSPRANIENWFANRAHVGEQAKKKMATLYLLLADADYTKQDSAISVKAPKASKSPPSTVKKNAPAVKQDNATLIAPVPALTEEVPRFTERHPNSIEPSLHIDIQIHIAPDASSTQIDQIFASMAKHFYRSKDVND